MIIGFEAKRVFHNKTGLGNYSRDLVSILSKFFPENNYLLYNPKVAKENLFEANQKNVFEKKPKTTFHKKFYNLWRQKGIVSDLIKDKIEIFHGLSGEIPSGLKKTNIKSVVTIHDLIFVRYPEFYSFFDRKIHFYKFKKAAKNADLIVAISEQTKNDIVEFLKIPSSKVKVVYQGCRSVFKEIYSEKDKEEVKKKYNLPEKFVLNVGTIEERKNAFSIVKAIKNVEIELVLIGRKTKYSQQIEQFIFENKMENRVHFLQNVSHQDLAIIYQLATVFVYPSVFEGFGIPIIEALYSKTPVITTNSGVFPEAGGPNSFYVDPFDIEEIKTKIELLLSNSQLKEEMTTKGFEFAQKFNDDNIAKTMMHLYKSI